MQILTSKIVNGKKMFLIEDNNPQGKVFAQDGKPIKKENISNYNPYYVDVKGLNASESTKTNLTPATKITPQEIKKIKESPTNVGNIKIKEAQEKAQRLKEAEEAYKKRKAGAPITPELLAQETQAIGDKISLQNIPGVGQYIPDMLDVTGGLGSMASNLGTLPLNLNRGNYGQAALSVVMPLGVGALAGIGNPNTGQFANNLINPFAGTGQIINKIGNKYLPNAYKLNPFAFKPDPEAFYRQVGKSAYDDAITKGRVFSNGQENMLERVPEFNYLDEYNKSIALDKTGKFNLTKPSEAPFVQKGELFFPINRKPTGKGYKGTKYADAEYLLEGKLPNEAVLPRYQQKYFPTLKESSNVGVIRPEFNELNNFNVYKRDWLKGYKQIEVPKSNFKSEIDWGKWNKEIPENKALMQEYNAIEQQAKANGTWMKNPDGSSFKGTPEQFVQQNSQNFKKVYPEGFENVFRGTGENIAELRPNRSIFTANQELASGYAPFNKKFNFLNSENTEGGLHNFYRKNSKNSLELDANNTSWTGVDLSNKRLTKEYFEKNIKFQEEQLLKRKHDLSKLKQLPNGSWTDGTDYVISNDLYTNWIPEQELYLRDLKERYKNIDNLVSNPRELEEMKKVLGNKTTTDDIAAYIEKRNLDYVKLKNIEDSGVGDVTIVNHKPGNYLKSAIGNNGMFDMTNPNIYKTLIPGAMTLGALNQTNEKQFGGTIKILNTKIENGKKYFLINE